MIRALTLAVLTLPMPALAHPHIFVDTTHQLIFDAEGRLEAVRVTWDYDELVWMPRGMQGHCEPLEAVIECALVSGL